MMENNQVPQGTQPQQDIADQSQPQQPPQTQPQPQPQQSQPKPGGGGEHRSSVGAAIGIIIVIVIIVLGGLYFYGQRLTDNGEIPPPDVPTDFQSSGSDEIDDIEADLDADLSNLDAEGDAIDQELQ